MSVTCMHLDAQDVVAERAQAVQREEEETRGAQTICAKGKSHLNGLTEANIVKMKQLDPLGYFSENESKDRERARSSDCIRVCVRVRPFAENEDQMECIEVVNKTALTLRMGNGCNKEFQFDRVFGPTSTQEDVYLEVSAFPSLMFEGYSCCVFAYGQTGSGKTYTMQGVGEDEGVSTRMLKEFFQVLEQKRSESGEKMVYEVEGSMFEIYNEQVIDLLASMRMNNEGSTEENQEKKNSEETSVEKKNECRSKVFSPISESDFEKSTNNFSRSSYPLSKFCKRDLSSYVQTQELLAQGYHARSTCSTLLNASSSRSHCILRIQLTCRCVKDATCLQTQLFLVDLAGSERLSQSGATGKSFLEAKSINKSLTILSRVMQALYVKQKYVPFRESLLTRLLKDALLGRSKTYMFITVSPCASSRGQTLNSLALGSSVKELELAPVKKLSFELDRKQLILHAKRKLNKFSSIKQSIQEAYTLKIQQVERQIQDLKAFILGLEMGQPIDPNINLSLSSPDATVKPIEQTSNHQTSPTQQRPSFHHTPSASYSRPVQFLPGYPAFCPISQPAAPFAFRSGADFYQSNLSRQRHNDGHQDHGFQVTSKENFQLGRVHSEHDTVLQPLNKPTASLLYSPNNHPSKSLPVRDLPKQKKTVSFVTPSSTVVHYQPSIKCSAPLRATPLKPKPSPSFMGPSRMSRISNAPPQYLYHPPSTSLPSLSSNSDSLRLYANHTLSTSQNLLDPCRHNCRRARRVLIKDPQKPTFRSKTTQP